MKPLIALCSAVLCTLFFAGCAGTRVTHVEVATGAANPQAIYIRPFSVASAVYCGPGNPNGMAIRKSQAPHFFAEVLSEELAKVAPTRVLKENEVPRLGWLVEGEFELINTGAPSKVVMHVRITDLGGETVVASGKGEVTTLRASHTRYGRVIYEFDVEGGSRGTGAYGSIYAPGTGDPVPFDFRNAAERIMLVLTPDAFRYGFRNSPVQRY